MRFISTRGGARPHTFLEAVEAGLAPDGGLFVPEKLPDIAPLLAGWEALSYEELAAEFFSLFADDVPMAELRALTHAAYARFEHPDVAPLVPLTGDGSVQVLELFHGPTLAFKDFALQLLGGFYKSLVNRTSRSLIVLGATSGDTGSAAIHGCLGQEGIRSIILYPAGRVSPLQERQMACTGDASVTAAPIPGTFDDAQRIVKEIFADTTFAREHRLAAVNSINISRVLAQCVYYIRAWLRLTPAARARGVTFVVPTGNFGNVLAGWMASRMGLPGCTFEVATNRNDILHRYFSAGDYSVAVVEPSLAPSMDIQLASNFERFLHYAGGCDPVRTAAAMAELRAHGRLPAWAAEVKSHFTSTRLDDPGIRAAIREVYQKTGYILCPHTACAFARPLEAGGKGPVRVILATAHAAKFPEAVQEATGIEPRHPSLERLKSLPLATTPVAADVASVRALVERRAS